MSFSFLYAKCQFALLPRRGWLPDILLPRRHSMHQRFEIDLAGLRRRLQRGDLPDRVESLADLRSTDHGRVAGRDHLNVQLLHAVHVAFELVCIEELEPGAVNAVK